MIPEIFHSVDTGKPFDKCLVCSKVLAIDGQPYVIEKAIRRYPEYDTEDVIFEFALCMHCMESTANDMSEESKRKIGEYFLNSTNNRNRASRLMLDEEKKIDDYISKCMITGKPIADENEYMICGYFQGDKMIYAQGENNVFVPFVLGKTAIDEISELQSQETIDESNRFMDEHFGGSPELKELLTYTRPILV